MQSDYSIAFMGTSLSWYWYFQPALVAKLQVDTGRFIRPFGYGYNGTWSDTGVSIVGQVVADRPDFVMFEYSMNDCAHISRADAITNTLAIITALKTALPANRIFLMTMNPSTDPTHTTLADYYADYRSLSASQGIGLIDNEPVWIAHGSVASYTPDGTHPYQVDTVAVTMPTIYSAIRPFIT